MNNTNQNPDPVKMSMPVVFRAVDKYVESNIVPATETKTRGDSGRVLWGPGNNYPAYLLGLYKDVATLGSIVNGCVDYVAGNDVQLGLSSRRKKAKDGGKAIAQEVKDGFDEIIIDMAADMDKAAGQHLAAGDGLVLVLAVRHTRVQRDFYDGVQARTVLDRTDHQLEAVGVVEVLAVRVHEVDRGVVGEGPRAAAVDGVLHLQRDDALRGRTADRDADELRVGYVFQVYHLESIIAEGRSLETQKPEAYRPPVMR